VTGNRIEIDGCLNGQPELRVTPAGTPVLRLMVESGEPGERLKLAVVMTGKRAAAVMERLVPGQPIKVAGYLRALRAAGASIERLEVVAESIEPGDS
jgi:primosomal replication protein N